jgi:uncharacterized membrane protein
MRGPPDKPNPTTGQDGRAIGLKSSSGLGSKTDENYASRVVFASTAKNPTSGWYAVTADSIVIGTFGTRLEAAQAFMVCP